MVCLDLIIGALEGGEQRILLVVEDSESAHVGS